MKEHLLQARLQAGFQFRRAAAEAIGVDLRTLARYETGETTPSADVLIRMADAYRVSLDQLLGRTPTTEPAA